MRADVDSFGGKPRVSPGSLIQGRRLNLTIDQRMSKSGESRAGTCLGPWTSRSGKNAAVPGVTVGDGQVPVLAQVLVQRRVILSRKSGFNA